ncbi:piggyBac transposable element-derived protein 4-like [Oreochromis niloticus]|uniref:piggyBac transposable element-derived protein 4-like n=1 Tax=Oreochromis niloticus TaxID=8128 RepID=UPI0009056182|nr:piggyBac transposable element-derived protein 4-like [Oreochromis niloticus]
MALRLCQDGGSQGESNRREGEEEAGAESGEEEAGAEPGRGTWEIWQEDDDAGRVAGGVHDPGRDRGHGAVGETDDADVADAYDYDDDKEDKDYEEEEEEEEDVLADDDDEEEKEEEEDILADDYDDDDEDKDYEEEEEEELEEELEDDDDDDDDLDPRGRGPTEEAVAAARDEASAFMAYFPPEIEDSVIAMTNLEADRRRPAIDGWKPMGRVEFRAYVGLLVLAGVYRSRGEACESLWDAESGRSVFRAAMPLKTFRAYSSALRFDDRETRRAGRGEGGGGHGYDKLAPIRAVWDEWCARLPAMYRPGPEVTVDERLVPFRGRCPFRQYMPSKPARYGIKIWVACDARSSYAWKMQVYTGKPDKRGPPEKHLATRVVVDLTEGLAPGRNVTCDNFFTSRELADRLFRERGHTVLGTLRSNRPEIPRELRCVKGRAVGSVESVVLGGSAGPRRGGGGGGGGGGGRGPDTIILSYVAKKNKNVLLLTTAPRYHHHHHHRRRSGPEPRPSRSSSNSNSNSNSNGGGGKPPLVLHYNRTKGGVDNLDKVVSTYSCRRKTCRWPVALFHNMVDVAAYNAFVLWREIHPDWMAGKLNKRRLFLERLGKALACPMIEARALARGGGGGGGGRVAARVKRRRCRVCPRSKDVKTKILCHECRVYVCTNCAVTYCPNCAASRTAASQTPPTL